MQQKTLAPALDAYNKAVRWERIDKALPYVAPSANKEFQKWIESESKKMDYQDWELKEVKVYEHATPLTATVEIERTGFEVPKYIEIKTTVTQTWIYDDLRWRIQKGF